jgi:hypothetical protein
MFSIPLARLKLVIRGKILPANESVADGTTLQLIGTAIAGGELPPEPGVLRVWAGRLHGRATYHLQAAPSVSTLVGACFSLLLSALRGVSSFLLSLVVPPPPRPRHV